ncbi:hypothetical protein PPYR_09954 [Photinus pyralis]|uniref:Methyltransferase type 11 domain-containing protein n=1 Tax=Photinus pyralis TaxID=7054 RepID=A0A5N4AEZ4_PHOPY|nr:ubiquinone biosynthesis O-methyltransferase, mitochondrial-like [Photinus pyralis]KAB0795893.1 hypothetical protein PPYR_09954 [Photinus pyralis]
MSGSDDEKLRLLKGLNERWWDEDGNLVTLHSSCKLIAPYIRDEIIHAGIARADAASGLTPLDDVTALEVGCGGGILTERLAKMGCTVTGIDVIGELIAVAKRRASSDPLLKTKVSYKKESIEHHAANNAEKYDVVVSHFCLEQAEDQQTFIESCGKCLKPGGAIFITTVSKTILSWLGIVLLYEKLFKCIPVGMHDWNRCLTADKCHQILQRHNLKTIATRGFYYNYFSKRSFWIRCASLFYITYAKKKAIEENVKEITKDCLKK